MGRCSSIVGRRAEGKAVSQQAPGASSAREVYCWLVHFKVRPCGADLGSKREAVTLGIGQDGGKNENGLPGSGPRRSGERIAAGSE
jgi:hypothetical protein